VHYEVRIRDTAVNPHKYLRVTLAELGTEAPAAPGAPVTSSVKAVGMENR
jgi:hypothetical protein